MSATIITREMLEKTSGGMPVSGVILVRNYSTAITKTNKEYIAGELFSGVSIPFKAWGQSPAFSSLKNEDYNGIPAMIVGKFDVYNDVKSIIIDSIQAVEGFSSEDFLPIKYNAEAYFNALQSLVLGKVSDKARKLCNEVIFNNETVKERFMNEFAASSHHDNCKSGLLAHTYKVVAGVQFITNNYAKLVVRNNEVNQDFVDLLYLGALFHDIGKIDEMKFGVYQPKSIVTHRYLGIEYITPYKEYLIESYDEKWYYDFISIFLQHHGEFGDDCRTLASLIIHEADYLDSKLTLIQQTLEEGAGDKFRYEGKYINV